MQTQNRKPTVVHQVIVLAFGGLLLWATTFYWWYHVTRRSLLVLLGTLAILPVPFLVWLIAVLLGRIARRAKTNRLLRYTMRLFIVLLLLGVALPFISRLITSLHARRRTFSVGDVGRRRVAIVFGAAVTPDGRLSPQLYDRVTTAAELYLSGKVEKLLMSGDNRFVTYNEPAAMREHAVRLGVPEEAIVLDYAGRRTYDTCYRARDIFQVRDVILVTQRYHLPRALYTCNALGVGAVGVPAERAQYSHLYNHVREFVATPVALADVHIFRPTPVLGEPEPVFVSQTLID